MPFCIVCHGKGSSAIQDLEEYLPMAVYKMDHNLKDDHVPVLSL